MRASERQRANGQQRPAWPGNAMNVLEVLPGSLAAAGRGQRRRDDVFDAVAGAHPAVVARGPAAVLDPAGVERRLPVVPQEVLVQPGAQMVPRQDLTGRAMSVHVPVEGESLRLHRLGPAREGEAL